MVQAVRSLIMLVFTVEDLLCGPLYEATHGLSTPDEAVDVLLTAAGELLPNLWSLVFDNPALRRGPRDQRSQLASLSRRAAHNQRAIAHRASKRARE